MKRLLVVSGLLTASMGLAMGASLFTVGSGVVLDASDGPTLELGETTGVGSENPFPSNSSIEVQGTRVTGPPGSGATTTGLGGDRPRFSDVDTSGGELTANSTGIRKIGVDGSIESFDYRAIELSNNETAVNVSGDGNLTVYDLGENQTVYVENGTSESFEKKTSETGDLVLRNEGSSEYSFYSENVSSESTPTPSDNMTGGGDPTTLTTIPVAGGISRPQAIVLGVGLVGLFGGVVLLYRRRTMTTEYI